MSRRHLDRFEAAGDEFHERVIDGFRTMAGADPTTGSPSPRSGRSTRWPPRSRPHSPSGQPDDFGLGRRGGPGPCHRAARSQPPTTGPGPRLPVHRPTGFDQVPGSARVRRAGHQRRRRPDATRCSPRARRRTSRRARGAPIGPSISADQAREIVRVSSLAPTESSRKVLILDEFHLLRPGGCRVDAEDDRGAARVDDVHHLRRLRATRADHDLVALRPDRLPVRSPTA